MRKPLKGGFLSSTHTLRIFIGYTITGQKFFETLQKLQLHSFRWDSGRYIDSWWVRGKTSLVTTIVGLTILAQNHVKLYVDIFILLNATVVVATVFRDVREAHGEPDFGVVAALDLYLFVMGNEMEVSKRLRIYISRTLIKDLLAEYAWRG